jgi:hypothetical protein
VSTIRDETKPDPSSAVADDAAKFKPVGTLALMLAVAGSMLVGWLFLYYAVFLHRGVIQ